MKTVELMGVVLSGGQSWRMGEDKALLIYRGKTLLQNCISLVRRFTSDLIISGRHEQLGGVDMHGVSLVEDIIPGIGPLGGIYSAMSIPARRYLILAVDMPFLSYELLKKMLNIPGNVVVSYKGRLQPLCSILEREVVFEAETRINRKEYAVMGLLDKIDYSLVEAATSLEVQDIDTPAEKDKYLR